MTDHHYAGGPIPRKTTKLSLDGGTLPAGTVLPEGCVIYK